jgi:adenylate cyclase
MTTEREKRKLAAVLHADVKGYSRLMGEDEEATVQTLAVYRQELVRLVGLHGGRLVDTAGDGFLVEFPSAVESVLFAVAFQKEIGARNAELPESRRMHFRIGINIGDVIQRGNEIFGDGVNIAARLEQLANPGGICISGTAYDQVKKRLGREYDYLGKQSVKNIEDPVRIYRVRVGTEEEIPESCHWDRSRSRRMRKAALVAIIAITAVTMAVGVWLFHSRFRSPLRGVRPVNASGLSLPDNPSIAVLPFTNMSQDPSQEYFGDGITEEIITGLAKVPRLFVIARNSTFAYKGKPVNIRQVGRELGVKYVLEGSIRKAGDRVRITAQLIDASDGRHVWAERYDRDFKDIFDLQDEITRKIVVALQVHLTEGEQIRLWSEKSGPTNPRAYDKMLQAVEHVYKLTKPGNTEARRLFREAIELDPNYAKPYAGLAWTYLANVWLAWSESPAEDLAKARQYAEKSMALNDTVDYPYFTLALIHLIDREYDKAIASAKRAVELSPNGAEAHAWLGAILHFAGRDKEAVVVLNRAIRLNPIPRSYYYEFLGSTYMTMGQYDKAIKELNKGLKRNPNNMSLYLCLASAYSLKGRNRAAAKIISRAKEIDPTWSLSHMSQALPYKDSAVSKRFIEALNKAGMQ